MRFSETDPRMSLQKRLDAACGPVQPVCENEGETCGGDAADERELALFRGRGDSLYCDQPIRFGSSRS